MPPRRGGDSNVFRPTKSFTPEDAHNTLDNHHNFTRLTIIFIYYEFVAIPMNDINIPKIAAAVFDLLDPLEPDDRQRVIRGVLAMLGDPVLGGASAGGVYAQDDPVDIGGLGPRASKWLQKFSISAEQLEHVFHFDGGSVDLLDIEVPGNSKRQKTINSYLLVGAKQFIATDEPKFDDKSAVEYCKRNGCHDAPNHAVARNALGNRVSGSKTTGYSLSVPGLKEAADVIKQAAEAAA